MRSRYHTRRTGAWAIRLTSDEAPKAVAPVQVSALDLPPEQKFGLLFLRRAGPESIASRIIERLNAERVAFPTGRHWHELRREGYVTLEPTGHRLTPKGASAAQAIMRDCAQRYSIHIITTTGGRGTGRGTHARCSCGTWSAGPFHNDRIGDSRLSRARASHLSDVENGLWPRTTMTDFLNEVAPLKFDFNSGTSPLVTSPGTNSGGPDPDAAVVSQRSTGNAASGISSEARDDQRL